MRKISIIAGLLVLFCLSYFGTVLAEESPSDVYSDIDGFLIESVKNLHIPGMTVVIVNSEDILFSNSYGICENEDVPYIIGSLSKSVTAVGIMQLVEEGKVSLDDAVSTYLPNVNRGDDITIQHLLNHTSGFDTYQKPHSATITNPIGIYQYANVNYCLLGDIIEVVSGMNYEQYVEDNVFAPLSMIRSNANLEKAEVSGLITGFRNYFGIPIPGAINHPNEHSWSRMPAGYISSSGTDMARYLQMYLKDGEGVLSKESIDAIFHESAIIAQTTNRYGFGWKIETNGDDLIYSHDGLVENYLSDMMLLPAKDLGIIMLVNTNDYLVANNAMGQVTDGILRLLVGEEAEIPSESQYVICHSIIDGGYLLLFTLAIWILIRFIRQSRHPVEFNTNRRQILFLVIIHLCLPVLLLCSTRLFAGTPLWVVRDYVPDLYLVVMVVSGLLMATGIAKGIRLICQTNRGPEGENPK